jgi:hypothetical protein
MKSLRLLGKKFLFEKPKIKATSIFIDKYEKPIREDKKKEDFI